MFLRLLGSLVTLTIACSVTGCGNDIVRPASDRPAASDSNAPLRGTERLAWDQSAPSYLQLRQYGFTAYIDGIATPLPGVECLDALSAAGYSCSSSLPTMSDGRHTIQLAAVVDGVVSAPSASITVTVDRGRLVDAQASTSSSETPPAQAVARRVCVGATTCFSVRREITRPVPVSSPVALPDGRLLYVEDDRHIRMMDDGIVAAETALSMADPQSRIVALLVDPSFEETRIVRIAWTEEVPRRGRSLVIGRSRELSGRLDQPAVLVPGIPLPATGQPRVTQDNRGRIYVAVPAPSGDTSVAAADPYAGSLLRFSPDGLAWSAGLGGPVFERGYERPHSLTFDSMGTQLWLSGTNASEDAALVAIPVGGDGSSTLGDQGNRHRQVTRGPAGLTMVGLSRIGSTDEFLGLDDRGGLFVMRPVDASATSVEPLLFEEGHPLSMDSGPGSHIFVTAASTVGAATWFSVFRLEPQLPAATLTEITAAGGLVPQARLP